MNWIKITTETPLPTKGNFIVCQNTEDFNTEWLDAIANVYWDQDSLSDEMSLYIETMGGVKVRYEYTPTHFIKI